MALENILNQLPESVTAAAAIALGAAPTCASRVDGTVMVGTGRSYENDNWVRITYQGDDVQRVVKVHPFSDVGDQDVTTDVLARLKEQQEAREQTETAASTRRGHRLIRR